MRNYEYSIVNNKVICITKFAGRTVRGVAKCDTSVDKFDVKLGKRLAKLRCDFKIMGKALRNALDHYNYVSDELVRAEERKERAGIRVDETMDLYQAVKQELNDLEAELE